MKKGMLDHGSKVGFPGAGEGKRPTIVIAEHVVPTDVIRREPERCVIPNLLVSHVVDLPFGAHPTSVYREYDYDADEINKYVEATEDPGIIQRLP